MKLISTSLIVAVVCAGIVQSRVIDSASEDCDKRFKGCSIEKGECVCGEQVGCANPYPYKDQRQCIKDIKGELDKCKREPCEHGQCLQAKHDDARRWECFCSGSGFYGKKCEIKCPAYDKKHVTADYPSDCVY